MLFRSMDEVEYDDGALEFDDDFSAYRQGVYISIYDANGRMLRGRELDISADVSPFRNDGEIYQVLRNGQVYLVYDLPYTLRGYGTLWFRGVMLDEEMTEVGAIGTVIQLTFIALPALTVLAAVVGYFLTKHSFKPVENIILEVEKINEGKDLTKRIDLGEGNDEIYRLAKSFDAMFER